MGPVVIFFYSVVVEGVEGVITDFQVLGEGGGLLDRFEADELHGDRTAVLVRQEEVQRRRIRILAGQ